MGEQDPKDPKAPESSGTPEGNQPGNPDPNVVALQKKAHRERCGVEKGAVRVRKSTE